MNTYQTDLLRGFDLLSTLAQQRLRARVADAGGDIGTIIGEIRAQLDELDRDIASRPEAVQRQRQADRAFFVGQLTYLDLLQHAEEQRELPQKRGILARLRSAFRHTPTVD